MVDLALTRWNQIKAELVAMRDVVLTSQGQAKLSLHRNVSKCYFLIGQNWGGVLRSALCWGAPRGSGSAVDGRIYLRPYLIEGPALIFLLLKPQ